MMYASLVLPAASRFEWPLHIRPRHCALLMVDVIQQFGRHPDMGRH